MERVSGSIKMIISLGMKATALGEISNIHKDYERGI